MFVDYITLMLVNMSAALAVLAGFLVFGLGAKNEKSWAPALAIPGVVGLATGLHMTLTWPIPKLEQVNLIWANVAFGETTVLLSVLLLAAAVAVAKGWDLRPIGVYALFAGAAGVLIGLRILDLGLTKHPTQSGIGFLLAGAGGLLVLPVLALRKHLPVRIAGAVLLLAAAAIWAQSGYQAYWSHLERFMK